MENMMSTQSTEINTHQEEARYRPLPYQIVGTKYNGQTVISHCNSLDAAANEMKKLRKVCATVTYVILDNLVDKEGNSKVKGSKYH